jgi:hypothetical protein
MPHGMACSTEYLIMLRIPCQVACRAACHAAQHASRGHAKHTSAKTMLTLRVVWVQSKGASVTKCVEHQSTPSEASASCATNLTSHLRARVRARA